ncbi:MAG TPA: sigma-70 family RNA polymerase sigma factor [Gemmataceae bacterium]|nr:sigma-70 family RNA polymerase sigma factor [Gemmataceae bacterium]
MASGRWDNVVQEIRRMAGLSAAALLTDRELLEAFVSRRDQVAFEVLVRRYGPLVLGVCKRILRHAEDAEDAFQATFLVLVRKAGTLRRGETVGNWLYGVAYRTALQARSNAARRRHKEAQTPGLQHEESCVEIAARLELQALLDRELNRLPDKYRAAIVLCDLLGKTKRQAAEELHCPEGTVSSRLAHGREVLKKRLARYGSSFGAFGSAVLLHQATAAVPGPLYSTTIKAAALLAKGTTAAACLTPGAVALMEGVLKSMLLTKSKPVLALILAASLLGGVAWGVADSNGRGEEATPPDHKQLHKNQIANAAPNKKVPLEQPKNDKKPSLRHDALGDLLPEGAIARLGSARRHAGGRHTLAFSPAEDLLASGGDGVIRLWYPHTGKDLSQIALPEKGVETIVFAPGGKLLAGAGEGPEAYLWDVTNGKEVRRLVGHNGPVAAVAFSGDGEVMATADRSTVWLWDVKSGKRLRKIDVGERGQSSLAFSPDGRFLAGADDAFDVQIWVTATGKRLRKLPHQYTTRFVTFSNDGKFLLTVGYSEVRIWETESGKRLNSKAWDNTSWESTALSPNGKILALSESSGLVRLWDWAAAKEIKQMPRRASNVSQLAFSADGKTLACVADCGAIQFWDTATTEPKWLMAGHQERLTSALFTPDGRTVITSGWDGTIRFWDAATAAETKQWAIDLSHGKGKSSRLTSLGSLTLSPNGKLLAGLRDYEASCWDVASGKELWRIPHISSLAFAPDNKLVACGELGGNIGIYDSASGKKTQTLHGHQSQIVSLVFTPDSKSLISYSVGVTFGGDGNNLEIAGNESKRVRVWNIVTGAERKHYLPTFEVMSVNSRFGSVYALSPDGKTLTCNFMPSDVTKKGTAGMEFIVLLESATGDIRGKLKVKSRGVFHVAFSPDCRLVATAESDGAVRIWNVFSGHEIACLRGHRHHVDAIAFSNDGKKLVSGSADTTALIWDVASIVPPAKTAKLTAADLEACWNDLGGNAQISSRAMATFISSPNQTVAFLGERLQPVLAVDKNRIAKLVGDLDSEQFKIRDLAMKELEKLGDLASVELENALGGNITLEKKRRVELLLDKLDGSTMSQGMLRQLRAVEALEHLVTGEARAVLQKLAAGEPAARLTREAAGAVERMTNTAKVGT